MVIKWNITNLKKARWNWVQLFKSEFLRDLKHDYENLGRVYFPDINLVNLTVEDKNKLVNEIEDDFAQALVGIKTTKRS